MAFDIPDFGRCCFCFPLRRGLVTFGYVNAIWSAFMIFILAHYNPFFGNLYDMWIIETEPSYSIRWEMSFTFYCFDVIFSTLLIFGAHLKNRILLQAFLYYVVAAVSVLFIFEFVELCRLFSYWQIMTFIYFLFNGSVNVFIAMLCLSLIKKIDREAPEGGYQNPLEQFVTGDYKENHINNVNGNPSGEVSVEVGQ